MLFELKNLTKSYGELDSAVYAVKDISINVSEGEFIALVGPSGSGKTTLLNLFAGLVEPSAGSITHKGTPIEKLNPEERTKHRLKYMGFVFQDYQLLPILTVKENVELPLQLQGFTQDEIDQKVSWALEQVGLKDYSKRFPKQLSGGQQQRVSIARAVASSPSVILADEPTANLDSKTAQGIIDLFKELNQKIGLTFIFSTHDQRLIDQVKRIIYLKDGQITL
jgi:putative ABC transport system ATP-binding protein